jgi:hypothetical protein
VCEEIRLKPYNIYALHISVTVAIITRIACSLLMAAAAEARCALGVN